MNINIFNSLILIFGLLSVVQDLRSRKVSNKTIAAGFIVILLSSAYLNEFNHVLSGLGGFVTTLFVGFILWRFGVLGAGDVKLMALMALSLSWERSLEFMFYSLAWGSLLGVFALILDKSIVQEMRLLNFNPIMTIRSSGVKGHKIPFTVAIVFGLLTLWVLQSKGVFFL